MPPIIETIEIARPPEEVFPYATDPSRFSEWQKGVVSGGLVGGGPAAIGGRCTTTRRIGGSERTTTQEITELTVPRRWAVRGIDGPIRANIAVTIDPIDDGRGSRLTISLDFVGQGLGRMIVPAIRREAAQEVPDACHALKLRLESGAPTTA
jgi:hypothetical protein